MQELIEKEPDKKEQIEEKLDPAEEKIERTLSKLDKVPKNNIEKNKKIIIEELKIKDNDNLILFSSQTKKGKEEVYEEIAKYQ